MRLGRPLAALLFAAALASGCASAPPAASPGLRPGDTVRFEGKDYQLRLVQEDYVLLAYREPGSDGGVISGYVDEIFRVSRYDLGEGRWYAHDRLPGLYLQWLGFDSFALARDQAALAGAPVVMVK